VKLSEVEMSTTCTARHSIFRNCCGKSKDCAVSLFLMVFVNSRVWGLKFQPDCYWGPWRQEGVVSQSIYYVVEIIKEEVLFVNLLLLCIIDSAAPSASVLQW